MFNEQAGRFALAFLFYSTLLEHSMHVLTMKHIVDISPAFLVVGKVIDTDRFPSSPVAIDEFT